MNPLLDRSTILMLLILLAFVQGSYAKASSIYAISEAPDYRNQRRCAQRCLSSVGGKGLKCDGPQEQQCMCATHVRSSASRWLSSCALGEEGKTDLCSGELNTGDYSAMVSIYDHYCGGGTSPSTTTETNLQTTDAPDTAKAGPQITTASPAVTAVVTQVVPKSAAGRVLTPTAWASFFAAFILSTTLSSSAVFCGFTSRLS